MRSIKPTTIRLSEDDIEMVEIIKKKYGQSSLIGVIRTALRIASGGVNGAANVVKSKDTAS